ncbi:hypothetical protein GCM10022232_82990 [Streptomyces plumbiresistens]|uniref:Integrase catalytic domain-containing protein n=1 Tax=Streptomyces plumbiresistens TaxID=511811 RepID=A0ABP7TE73_9ACTN
MNHWGYPRLRGSVERLMREHGIAGHSRRTGRRSLTRADRRAAPVPDLIERDFTAAAPGLRVVGDITYIPTIEGWLYLAAWLDLGTREVIGYSMADHHRADLVVEALAMAAGLGHLEDGCIIHTDRGSSTPPPNSATDWVSWGSARAWGGPGSASTTPPPRVSSPPSRGVSEPASGMTGRAREPTSSLSSRPTTTAGACADIPTGATSRPTGPASGTTGKPDHALAA